MNQNPNQMLQNLMNGQQPAAPAPQQQFQQQQQPPAQQFQQPVQQQAPPQQQFGGQPQAQPTHQPLVGGLAQYANMTQGLYGEVGGDRAPRVYFDCEAKYVVEVTRLSTGRSTKPTQNGRPYFGANFKVLRIDYLGCDPTQTQIKVGTEISYMKWLPRDPNYPSLEDKYNFVDVLNLGAAICGLKKVDENNNPYLNLGYMDQMAQDDGALAKGKVIGIQVTGKPGKAGTPSASRIFYNADFYPVDPSTGERVEGLTLQQAMGS